MRRTLLLASIPALGLVACVTREHEQVVAAREAYRQCVAAHAASSPECAVLRQRQLAAERRYADHAKQAWACDPAQQECPTHR